MAQAAEEEAEGNSQQGEGEGEGEDWFCTCIWAVNLYLFKIGKVKVDITVSKILNYEQVVVQGWWKDVDSSNNTLNETEFKIPLSSSM